MDFQRAVCGGTWRREWALLRRVLRSVIPSTWILFWSLFLKYKKSPKTKFVLCGMGPFLPTKSSSQAFAILILYKDMVCILHFGGK